MNKFDQRVAGMFRRGLPEGDQLDLLTAWLVLKLTNGETLSSMKLLSAISASVERATDGLSTQRDR